MKKVFLLVAVTCCTMFSNATMTTVLSNMMGADSLIYKAVAAASAGDTIELASSYYELPSGSGMASFREPDSILIDKPLTIIARAKTDVTMRGGFIISQPCHIEGFNNLLAKNNGTDHTFISLEADIKGTIMFKNCSMSGLQNFPAMNMNNHKVDSLIYDNCIFSGATIIYKNIVDGGKDGEVGYFQITNSTIYDMPQNDLVYITHCENAFIDHVTFYSTTTWDIFNLSGTKSGSYLIQNSIFMISQGVSSYACAVLSNGEFINCIVRGWGKDPDGVTMTNCSSEDPLFENAPNHKFKLLAGSPAFEAATDGTNIGDNRWGAVQPEIELGNHFKFNGMNFSIVSTNPLAARLDSAKDASGEITVPYYVQYREKSVMVDEMADGAFKDNANITKVTVCGYIDTIPEDAFYNCASLKVAKLNEGVKFLENKSFNGTHLDTIFIPASLTGFTEDLSKIMETDVKWYEVAAGNVEVSSMDGVLFNADSTTLLYFPIASERSEYTVPAGVDTISQYAVSMDTNLVSIKLPDVVMVGDGAFADCGKLASVEFSDAIDSIGGYGFFSDTVLTTIICPAIVPPALGEMVFYFVTLSNITLYVPAESISTYQAADTWKEMNIQSLATAIEQVDSQKSKVESQKSKVESQKYIREGQLIIERNNIRYNAQGQVVK